MRKMKQICDWSDFVKRVKNVGHVYEMKVPDFKNYESKQTRPTIP